jgi:hypothetical protein
MACGLPADDLDRTGDCELRRACIGQSRSGPISQRDRCRFDRIFHAQRQSDCFAIPDEQRNTHPSADANIHERPIAHRVAHAYHYANRNAWPHIRWHGTQNQGAHPDVPLRLRAAC